MLIAPFTMASIPHVTTRHPAPANQRDKYPRPPDGFRRFAPSELLRPDPHTRLLRFRVCVCCGANTEPVDAGDTDLLPAGAFCLLTVPPDTTSHSYCPAHLRMQAAALANPRAWGQLQAETAVYKHARAALLLAYALAGMDPYGGWGEKPPPTPPTTGEGRE